MASERAAIAIVVATLVAGCRGDATATDRAATTGAPPLASKPFYRLDAAPQPPCTAGAPCELRLVLTALGDYHVNPQYPHKFVADAAPDVVVETGGAMAIDGAKTGTLTVRFRANQRGPARLRGTFKLSVCNDDRCEIETPAITVAISAS
jgi:hypothetical protein